MKFWDSSALVPLMIRLSHPARGGAAKSSLNGSLAPAQVTDQACVMADPARTVDPAEAVDLATRNHEPVIVERDGSALAAVIPIDLFEKWSRESGDAGVSLVDELLAISSSLPDEEWAKLPEDGAENVDRYLHGSRP